MVDAYTGFGGTLLVVAVLGLPLALKRVGVGQRAMDWSAALVTIVGLMTSASLVAIAFVAGRFVGHEALQPASGDFGTAVQWTGGALLTGGSGLLCAAVGVTCLRYDFARRWAGGCLAVSCLGVLVLLPAPVVLIWEAAQATPLGG